MRSLALAAACLIGAAAPAHAQQSYPDKPIRMVVPFPPGGVTDLLARDISARLNQRWGQPVVVDNRGGANGNIGAEIAARARGDGYTILIAPANIAISVALYKHLGYSLSKDLVPVTLLAKGPYILVCNPSLPVHSVSELIALAKAQPGKVLMASSGTGSAGHLAGEILQAATGTKFTHVPYKGQAAAMTDLIGGQVSIFFATVAVVNPHRTDGRIRVLAVTTDKRSAILPDVPTIAESGFPGFDVGAWHGAFVPTGTPQPIVAKLHDELVSFLRSPEAQKRYSTQGLELVGTTQQAFAQFLKSQVAQYAKVIELAHVRVD
jgi:tripartite-type tricarboxylate transporter receptor subunit TctC